jgi:hypothetical protein
VPIYSQTATYIIQADTLEGRVGRLLDHVLAAAEVRSPDQPIYRIAGAELELVRDAIAEGPLRDRATLPRLRRVREMLALVKDAAPLDQAVSAIIGAVAAAQWGGGRVGALLP